MPDMLVKLYDLPALDPAISNQRAMGVNIRRCLTPEKFLVLGWIREHFSGYWVSEADAGFSVHPTTVMLAHRGDQLLGFACYDTTFKGYFGPTGVDAAERGQGIGSALLLATLHAMRDAGYMYAIIGGAGPVGYYEKVGAAVIPDSEPSRAYRGMLGTEAVYAHGAPSDSFLGMESINQNGGAD